MAVNDKSNYKDFTKLNKKTKRAERMIDAFIKAPYQSLYSYYEKPSYAKARAYNNCLECEYRNNGYDGRVTGGNTCTFSYAFLVTENDITYLCYITAYNNYIIEI